MTTPPSSTTSVAAPGSTGSALRASDAEREAAAARVRQAAGEGRLNLAEADERQAAAYAARTRDELLPLTADLPEPPRPDRPEVPRGPMTQAARRWFLVHSGVVALLVGFLVTAWAISGAPWFWPAWPLFWLAVSLLVHRRLARRERPRPS